MEKEMNIEDIEKNQARINNGEINI